MAKKSDQTTPAGDDAASRRANSIDRVARARDDYFRELYGTWQEVMQQMNEAQRDYQQRLSAIASSDEMTRAHSALADANRGYTRAVQVAAATPAADSRDAINAERDKYASAVEALTNANAQLQQQAQTEQQGHAERWRASQADLQQRYGAAFQRYIAAHVESVSEAGDALDAGLAYTLAQHLLAVASHAGWLQRASGGGQQPQVQPAA